jgi:hypothetical protein
MITGDQRADWPNIKDEARQWGESNGYVVHTVNPVVLDTLRGRPDKVRGQRAKLTDEQIFKAYCNRMKLSPNQQKSGSPSGPSGTRRGRKRVLQKMQQ